MPDHVIAPITGVDFVVDASEPRPARAKTDAQRLLEIMNRNSTNMYEAERARLKLEREKREREQAERTAAAAAVRDEQAKAREVTQANASRGIEMPPSPPAIYIDPISGSPVAFAGSAAPLTGLLPPPPPAPDLPRSEDF